MICFDTNIAIYAVQQTPHVGAEALAERARRYRQLLKERREQIALAALSVAEYLAFFPEAERRHQEEVIERNFIILPFDGPAAVYAANILCRKAAFKTIGDFTGSSKQRVKVDSMIVAVAARWRVSALVSHDAGIRGLAPFGPVNVIDLPELETMTIQTPALPLGQKSLFDPPELPDAE